MASHARRRRPQQEEFETVVHELVMPERLLAWAATPEVAVTLQRDWAYEVRSRVAQWRDQVVSPEQFEEILAPLDALVSEALRAKRYDLFADMDMFVAEWLGVRLVLSTRFGVMEIGRGGPWTYGEIRTLIRAKDPQAIALAVQAKALVQEVFPGTTVDKIERQEEPETCTSCANPGASCMMQTDSGSYCRECWVALTDPKPIKYKPKGSAKAKAKAK